MKLNKSKRTPRRAFTLVELLVVIAIIALLIGILVPTVSIVRVNARKVATRATLTSLETAIQVFRGDSKFGGELPPSAGDKRLADQSGAVTRIANPYTPLIGGGTIDVSGASLLYFALAGADSLGTVGFKVLRSPSSGNPDQVWVNDQGNEDRGSPQASGGYALNPTTQQPYWPRAPLYVDLSKMGRSQFNPNTRSFEIPAEIEVAGPTGAGGAPDRKAPMFLDSFGFPILYWKADTAGAVCADESREIPDNANRPGGPSAAARGIYHWTDNGALVASTTLAAGRNQSLRLSQSGKEHAINWAGRGGDPQFWNYIRDPRVTAKAQPHNSDSFLLITPGPDGVYGTTDDIDNFEHNGK